MVEEETTDPQLERLRQMSPSERWDAAKQLYWSMRRMKSAYLRTRHPEWSEERVQQAVKEAFRFASD